MSGFVPILIDAKLPRENAENLAKQGKAVAIISDDNHEYSVDKIRTDNILQSSSSNEVNSKWANEVIFSSSGTTGDAKLMVFNGEKINDPENDNERPLADIIYFASAYPGD